MVEVDDVLLVVDQSERETYLLLMTRTKEIQRGQENEGNLKMMREEVMLKKLSSDFLREMTKRNSAAG